MNAAELLNERHQNNCNINFYFRHLLCFLFLFLRVSWTIYCVCLYLSSNIKNFNLLRDLLKFQPVYCLNLSLRISVSVCADCTCAYKLFLTDYTVHYALFFVAAWRIVDSEQSITQNNNIRGCKVQCTKWMLAFPWWTATWEEQIFLIKHVSVHYLQKMSPKRSFLK